MNNSSSQDLSLPALAPRASAAQQQPQPPAREAPRERRRGRGGATVRSRSSHRSRAGCWTCRTRKVKCDETHPRCGQCTRLNKTCDWEQRWKFDNSTKATQDKFENVKTAGNHVWDPSAPKPTSSQFAHYDTLPPFAELATDEDRERKAEVYAPGTFNVIANSDSFSRSTEYSDNDSLWSAANQRGKVLRSNSAGNAFTVPGDPNSVVLVSFDDSQPASTYPASLDGFDFDLDSKALDSHQSNHPQIADTPMVPRGITESASLSIRHYTDNDLFLHYEQFVAPRLYPLYRVYNEKGMPDVVLAEARSFPPLHHAVCAISLLSLYSKGLARWESALEREAMATSALSQNVRGDEQLNSISVLYVHFLLMVYDLCDPVNDGNIWLNHMKQVERIMETRLTRGRTVPELCWQILARTVGLEILVSLSGKDLGVSRALETLGHRLQGGAYPIKPLPLGFPDHAQEMEMMGPLLTCIHNAAITSRHVGQLAEQFRRGSPVHTAMTRHNAIVELQDEMWYTWRTCYPQALPFDDPDAARSLVPRMRELFDSANLFHCVNVMYSSTCMYPGQLLMEPSLAAGVHTYARRTITIARSIIGQDPWSRPQLTFAVFLAGVCSNEPEVKTAATQILERLEMLSIGRGATRAKALLSAVVEEQQRRTMRGGRAQEVHWITVAQERHMDIMDFGL